MRISFAVILALSSLPVTAQAQDASQWTGFYGGLTYSDGKGHQLYDTSSEHDVAGSGAGAMIGYNHSSGAWVFGGELAYNSAEIYEVNPDYPTYTFTSIVDLKARAGYAMKNVLVYGTVGATFTQWQEDTGNGGYDGQGALYGVGIDYLVSPRVFVGAEYLLRNVTSDYNPDPTSYFDADVRTFSVRVGMKF